MLNSILAAAFSNSLNQGFTLVIIGLTALAVIGAFSGRGLLARLTAAAPGLLTAIGVLGTFVGILIGLLDFEVADISKSVPQLLEGMKTAFVTSVFGMGGGILVKLVSEVVARPSAATEHSGVEDVLDALNGIRKDGEKARTEMAVALDKVRVALTGDNESSLVTQLQRLRTDVTDEIRESRRSNADLIGTITNEIRTISTTLTESASKAIVEALERSIRDFNDKLSEQFGENFKQLNVAVGRLLDWQENYRQQMMANAEALRDGAAGIQAARAGLEAIGSQATALVDAAANLRSLLDALGTTRAELEARLEAFRTMADQAAGAMPLIQTKLDELTTGFARQVDAAAGNVAGIAADMRAKFEAVEDALQAYSKRFVDALGEAVQEANEATRETASEVEKAIKAIAANVEGAQSAQAKMLVELSEGYARLRDDAEAVGEEMQTTIKEAGEALRETLSQAAAEMQKSNAETARVTSQQLQRTADEEFRRIAASLDDQVKQLDGALKTELERALTGMGSQLVSLTGKFVDDYRELTNRISDAVRSMERMKP